jgi:hypothetical protein
MNLSTIFSFWILLLPLLENSAAAFSVSHQIPPGQIRQVKDPPIVDPDYIPLQNILDVNARFQIALGPGIPPPQPNYTGVEYTIIYDPMELELANHALDIVLNPGMPNGAFLGSNIAVIAAQGAISVKHPVLAAPRANVNAVGFLDSFRFNVRPLLFDDEVADISIRPGQYIIAGGPNVAWNNVPDEFEVQIEEVPAPPPVFGVMITLKYVRKMRKLRNQMKDQ